VLHAIYEIFLKKSQIQGDREESNANQGQGVGKEMGAA
jgi:hypothetical protein